MSTAQSPPESAGTAGAAAAVEPGPWPAHHRIGSFEIVTVLRTGDAGVLYRAWDHALAQPVLLEEFMPPALAHRDAQGQMRPSLPAAAAVLERAGRLFIEEARVLAHGNHPNLARVLHLVEAHGTAYRVMPGYSGRPLADLLAAGEAPHEERDIRTLLTDLLGALQAWQAQAGAHGGVNAAQVLWLEEGHALLLGPDAASQTPLGHAGGPAASGGAGGGAAFGPAGGHAAFGGATGHAAFAGDLGANQAIVADLQAAAALARACLKARPPDSSRPPLSPDLAATLDAVLSSDPAQWPAHAAQFRQWLAQGPPGRVAAPEPSPTSPTSPTSLTSLTSPMSPASPALPASPAPLRASPELASSAPSAPVTASAPPTSSTPPASASHADVDAATSDLIRRVVDAIPERDAAPPAAARPAPPRPLPARAPPAEPPVMPLHPAPARAPQHEPGGGAGLDPRIQLPAAADGPALGGAERAWHRPPQRRSGAGRWWVGATLVLLVLAAVGLGLRYRPQLEQALGVGRQAAVTPAAITAGRVPAPAPPAAQFAAPPAASPAIPPATAPATPPVTSFATPSPSLPSPRSSETTAGAAMVAGSPAAAAPPGVTAAGTDDQRTADALGSPRDSCGSRTAFALYRCMQQQCAQPRWRAHPQCVQLRQTDQVPD